MIEGIHSLSQFVVEEKKGEKREGNNSIQLTLCWKCGAVINGNESITHTGDNQTQKGQAITDDRGASQQKQR